MANKRLPYGGRSFKGTKGPKPKKPSKGKIGVSGSSRPLGRFFTATRRQRRNK